MIDIFRFPLSVDYNRLIKATLEVDVKLRDTLKEKCDKLWLEEDIEVWIYNNNIAVTEDGYKVALYQGTRSFSALWGYLKP